MTELISQPFEAFTGPTKWVSLKEAVGERAACGAYVYPPGNPFIIPGMVITQKMLHDLLASIEAGAIIEGIDAENGLIEVVVDSVDQVRLPGSCAKLTASAFEAAHPEYELVWFKTDNIPSDIVKLVADTNAYIWAGKPYCTFAFDPNRPDVTITPWSLPANIALAKKDEYSLEELETINLDGTGLFRWVDRELSYQVIRDRFSDPGYLVLIRHRSSGKVAGVLHTRAASLERLWRTEEWENSLLMSRAAFTPCVERDAVFFQKALHHFGLHPEDQVFTASLQYVAPELRGSDAFLAMHRILAEIIHPEHALLPFLAEIPDEGTGHILGRAVSDRYIYEMLPNKHGLIHANTATSCLAFYLLDHKVFRQRVKRMIRALKAPYVPSVSDNPKLEVRQTENGKGWGVFATDTIEPGELLAEFTGETYIAENGLASQLPRVMVDHAVQVSDTAYVFGENNLAALLNHSCEPAARIEGATKIVAAKKINKNQEVTWDYRCTEDSDWVLETCECGTSACTGTIRGFSSLPVTRQLDYLRRNMVSQWIREKYSYLL